MGSLLLDHFNYSSSTSWIKTGHRSTDYFSTRQNMIDRLLVEIDAPPSSCSTEPPPHLPLVLSDDTVDYEQQEEHTFSLIQYLD
ncbi:hypothetical protein QR680_011027 [Steinernema hermaphroditum]|uniref:Uncharacterized protein n=1 Tax=Steinernema hermaphroditum TaxID=289476 RepID=A0AA39MBM2_9BILA|nr:hypothetical protein QR680_011027 [Steinernema hermaphroditum]